MEGVYHVLLLLITYYSVPTTSTVGSYTRRNYTDPLLKTHLMDLQINITTADNIGVAMPGSGTLHALGAPGHAPG